MKNFAWAPGGTNPFPLSSASAAFTTCSTMGATAAAAAFGAADASTSDFRRGLEEALDGCGPGGAEGCSADSISKVLVT